TAVGKFRVVETEGGPATGFVPLAVEGWQATASPHREAAGRLIDRDAWTGWGTEGPQEPGQWVAVGVGRGGSSSGGGLLGVDFQEVPAGYRVEVAREGKPWQEVQRVPHYWGPMFWSEQHAFLKARRGRVQAMFRPVRARHIRVVQTGASPDHAWSAREIFV